MENFSLISGCSGGGKSTLLRELSSRGFATVEEPGRRIVAEELESGGTALPWTDPEAFIRRAIRLSLSDRAAARDRPGWVFFDRGLIDAASALQSLTGKPILDRLAKKHGYHETMFMAPPWPEIYVRDHERRHDLVDALEEYERLCLVYPSLGYHVRELPKVSVAGRADFVLSVLGLAR